MPIPLIRDRENLNYWNENGGQEVGTSTWSSVAATVQLTNERSIVGVVSDLYAMESLGRIEGQPTLSVSDLNERYKDLGIPWTSPQKEAVAEYIANSHRRRQRLQRRIDLSPDGIFGGAARFGAEVLVAGPEAMLFGAGVGAGFRAAGLGMTRGLGARAAISFGENVIGGIPGEAAALYRDQRQHFDVEVTDALRNIAVGGLFGTALEVGPQAWTHYRIGERASDRVRSAGKRAADALGVRERIAAVEAAVKQMSDGKSPVIGPAIKFFKDRLEGVVRPKEIPGKEAPTIGNNIVSGRFYGASPSRVEELALRGPEDSYSGGTFFGPGLRGSSDLAVENAAAARNGGLIHQFDVNAKLIDVDDIIPREVLPALKDIGEIEKLVAEIQKGEPVSLREIYDNLSPEQAKELSGKLSSMGYDGLHGKEGPTGSERDFVHIFPDKAETSVRAGEPMENDPSIEPKMGEGEIDQLDSQYKAKENDMFHSQEELDASAEKVKRAQEVDATEEEFAQEQLDGVFDMAKRLEEEGELTPEGSQMLKDFQQSTKEPKGVPAADRAAPENVAPKPFYEKVKDGERIIKSMFNCVGTNG